MGLVLVGYLGFPFAGVFDNVTLSFSGYMSYNVQATYLYFVCKRCNFERKFIALRNYKVVQFRATLRYGRGP